MIKWDKTYSVGDKDIDIEHQQLFGLLEVVKNYPIKDAEYTKKIIFTLNGYIRSHFAHEEALMEKIGYENIEKHKRQHQEFIQKVQDFEREYESKNPELQIRMVEFLKAWLSTHILISDMDYAAKIKQQVK